MSQGGVRDLLKAIFFPRTTHDAAWEASRAEIDQLVIRRQMAEARLRNTIKTEGIMLASRHAMVRDHMERFQL